MKNITLFILFATACGLIQAQADPGWAWARRGGGTGEEIVSDMVMAPSLMTTAKYVVGSFSGLAVFGSTTLWSGTGYDIFVACMDNYGNWAWALRAGGVGEDRGLAIARYGSDLYITGSFSGTAQFGSYYINAHGTSETDVFVAKLTTEGSWIWVTGGGGNSADAGMDIACSGDGASCYITGLVGPGASNFGSHNQSYYDEADDLLVAKLSSGGGWVWVNRVTGQYIGSNDTARGYALTLDSAGNIYVTGHFSNSMYFPYLYDVLSGGDATDIFVAKLNSSGSWLAAISYDGTGFDAGFDIKVDNAGYFYVTGYFTGTLHFAADWQGFNYVSSAGLLDFDIFIGKGSFDYIVGLWVHGIGSLGNDYSHGMALAGTNLWVTGEFRGSMQAGPNLLTSNGGADAFCVKLDTSGNWLMAKRAGGVGNDFGRMVSYAQGYPNITYIFVAGDFEQSVDFGSALLASAGESDVFITNPNDPGSIVKPLPPQNVILTLGGGIWHLQWDPVTQNTSGNPVTPALYRVWYSGELNGLYVPLGTTTDCWYNGDPSPQRRFLKVTAVVYD